jgi:CHC2 zinc finger/Toprim domain
MTSLPPTLIERAREADILSVARRYGVRLKRDCETWYSGPCPNCGGDDRFWISTLKQRFSCRGCEARGDVIALVKHIDGCDFRMAVERLTGGRWRPSMYGESYIDADIVKAAPEASGRARASAARIVSGIHPLAGTPGERYLRDVRRIDVATIEDVLSRTDAIGWHGSVYFNEPEYPRRGDPPHPLHGRKLGAIIGIMTDPVTAERTGAISRTYLAPDRTKVGKAKTLGSPRGIVRLSRADEVLAGLFLAEGLATALAAMSIGLRPMWSTGSTSMMASFPVLCSVEALNIIVDHDANGAGEKAAREVEARWRTSGREVNLLRSDALGDLNDALKGGAL